MSSSAGRKSSGRTGVRRSDRHGDGAGNDRSFCCWLISATSEKFVLTSGAGVEPDVRLVSNGPFGPPIPGGSSFTSRLKPRGRPPPRARNDVGPGDFGEVSLQLNIQVVFQRQGDRVGEREVELAGAGSQRSGRVSESSPARPARLIGINDPSQPPVAAGA